MSKAIDDIAAERVRQISEGWTPEHDDEHVNGALSAAASCYAANACLAEAEPNLVYRPGDPPPAAWPWDKSWWKPNGVRRDLIRAAALIADFLKSCAFPPLTTEEKK